MARLPFSSGAPAIASGQVTPVLGVLWNTICSAEIHPHAQTQNVGAAPPKESLTLPRILWFSINHHPWFFIKVTLSLPLLLLSYNALSDIWISDDGVVCPSGMIEATPMLKEIIFLISEAS